MPALRRARRQHEQATQSQLRAMREHVKEKAENRPGVYHMIASDGEVVYVGKSKAVRSRLLSYFRCGAADKGAHILRQATDIRWEYVPSEFAALLAELRLIKTLRPRLNVAMKRDARHHAFIKLVHVPAPKLLVVRGAGSEDDGTYFGPFYGAQRIGEAVRELNDVLGLRDCSLATRMSFSDQAELFPLDARTPGCIRYEVKKCLGPCIAAVSEARYMERVMLAQAFLDGQDDAPLEQLRAEMLARSERLEFERAARLRDKLQRMEELRAQFARLRFAVETLSFLYRVPGHAGDDRVYLIRRGRVRGEAPAPRTTEDYCALRDLVADVFGSSEPLRGSVPAHEVDELLLLSSWFRRFPAELSRTSHAS